MGEFERFGLGRAGFDTDAAAGAVFDIDLEAVIKITVVFGLGLDGDE